MRPASTMASTTACSTGRSSNKRQEYRDRARSIYDIQALQQLKIKQTQSNPKSTQRVPKEYPKQQSAKRSSRAKVSERVPKVPSAKPPIALKLSVKVPMVIRKAKGRHLFTFERLCYAAGVRIESTTSATFSQQSAQYSRKAYTSRQAMTSSGSLPLTCRLRMALI